jgi:hypothetical protein
LSISARHRVDRRHVDARGEHAVVAIDNVAAHRRHGQRPIVLAHGLADVLVVPVDLQVDQPRLDGGRPHGEQHRDDEDAAADRGPPGVGVGSVSHGPVSSLALGDDRLRGRVARDDPLEDDGVLFEGGASLSFVASFSMRSGRLNVWMLSRRRRFACCSWARSCSIFEIR